MGTDVVEETFTCACPTTPATENIATADIAAECAAICDIKDADNKSICNSEKEKKVAACKPCADCHAAIEATKDDDTFVPATAGTNLRGNAPKPAGAAAAASGVIPE